MVDITLEPYEALVILASGFFVAESLALEPGDILAVHIFPAGLEDSGGIRVGVVGGLFSLLGLGVGIVGGGVTAVVEARIPSTWRSKAVLLIA